MAVVDFGLLALAGYGVGLIVGLTGVGGGSIMTPLLITAFGIPAPVAVGTDLACAAVTKTAGTLAHRAARNIAGRIVFLLALLAGGLPGIVLGSFASRRVPIRSLRMILIAALALAGAKLLT